MPPPNAQDSPLSRDTFEDLYRHCQGPGSSLNAGAARCCRHVSSFADVNDVEPMVVDPHHGLQILDARDYDIRSPRPRVLASCHNPCRHDRRLPPNHDTVFILLVNQRAYLVNSEGFDYCKFVTPCVIRHGLVHW